MKPPIPIMLRMCLTLTWHEHMTNTFPTCVWHSNALWTWKHSQNMAWNAPNQL